MRLRWLTQALADLREIHGYIARDKYRVLRGGNRGQTMAYLAQ